MVKRRVFAWTLAAGSVFAASPALAQEQAGYASNHFNPSERGSQWFALDSLDLRGNGRIALGLVNDYSYRTLLAYHPDGDVTSIVRNQYYAHLGASVNFIDRFRLALSVPIQIYGDGHDATINGVFHRRAHDVAVGDVRVSGDVRIVGEKGDPGSLALGAELMLPSGSKDAYTGDGEPRITPRLLFAGEVGAFIYAAKFGYQVRIRDEAFGNGYIGDNLVYGASAGVQLADKKLVIGPELFGSTVTSDGRAFDKRTSPLEVLLGTHWDAGANVRLGAGIGTRIAPGYGAPVAHGLLSIEWVPGMPKPEAAPAEPAKPVEDRDGDGVPDCEDACSYEKGERSDDPAKNGCPVVHDADADGVPDDQDACPNQAGVRSSDPKTNGCAPDRDGDGVSDFEDACPAAAGPRTDDPKTNGCPVDTDRDKDGVPNDVDACPDEPGKPDPDPKKNGCPKAFLQQGVIKITDQVRFKTGSAELLGKESDEVLQAVLGVLKAHPEIQKVSVEGHTDNVGDAARNKTLSKSRAESVVKWLTAHGVEASKLSSEGFGQEKPIEPNTTEEGRTANRRVEFHVEQGQAGGNAR